MFEVFSGYIVSKSRYVKLFLIMYYIHLYKLSITWRLFYQKETRCQLHTVEPDKDFDLFLMRLIRLAESWGYIYIVLIRFSPRHIWNALVLLTSVCTQYMQLPLVFPTQLRNLILNFPYSIHKCKAIFDKYTLVYRFSY